MYEVDAPVLVYYRPADDRGMVAVAVDDAFQCGELAGARALGRQSHVRQFGPDQQTHPVGDLVVSRVGRLDVAPQAVEPEFLGLTEFVFEKLGRRGCADRIRVIVLV